jgi:SAM-dependent methyltransferase
MSRFRTIPTDASRGRRFGVLLVVALLVLGPGGARRASAPTGSTSTSARRLATMAGTLRNGRRTVASRSSTLRAAIRATVADGPVLDLGTPSPFFKELAWLEPHSARPYWSSDVRTTPDNHFTADVRHVPVRSGSVGGVICQSVLNYLSDPQTAVDELHRVLRPGGRAYVTLTATSPYTGGYPGFPGDVTRFTPRSAAVLFAGWSEHR